MTCKLDQGQVSSPGANTTATVTIGAPGAGEANVLWRVDWSYSATPTAGTGNLTISDGSATVYELDIAAAGPGSVDFPNGSWADPNVVVTVALNAGGTSVLGKVNVQTSVESAR